VGDGVIAERVEEHLGSLRRRERAGLAVLAVLIVGGAVFWYVRSLPRPVTIAATGRASPPGVAAPVSPSPSPAILVVHVAGRVRYPGVYQFHQGDRVIDAIRAAGGAREGADLRSINLAALLTDGQQIVVWKRGSIGAPGVPTGGGGVPGPGSPTQPVNLNTATLDQLESLPGIGPALGQRILDYRQLHGPFASVDELVNVSGIGEKRMEDLRPLVTV
jgi:competence protein ComEA